MGSKNKKTTLHLGCGYKKIPNSIGVDIDPKSQADVVHNLDKFPYPFKTNTFSKIIADDILEHLDNIPKVLEEIHRISINGAVLQVTTGHFSSVDSFTDPTHKHFFTTRTFDYFIPKTDLHKYKYSKAIFKKRNIVLGPKNSNNPFIKLILALINRHQVTYEKRFAFIFPVGVIYYDLEVVKDGKN